MQSQRELLISFLKDRRARIKPADLGLPDAARRRTPGLRREDVAAIAGVSVTWYTWLEQGRDIRVSEQVLEKIATALRLDSDERDYLFMLTQHRLPAPAPADEHYHDVGETLRRMIDSLGIPAIVTTERWDVLYWNSLVTAVIRDYRQFEPAERNLLKILFINEADRLSRKDFEAMAHRVVPKFRVDFSQSAAPEAFEDLVDELSQASSLFKQLWDYPDLATRSVGVHTLDHEKHGPLQFEHSSYVPEGSPHLRVIIYAPWNEGSASIIAEQAQKIASA
ncbi:MAG: helix-turn-helix transcriptional regulator [Gammaproteobacteria bacterium]